MATKRKTTKTEGPVVKAKKAAPAPKVAAKVPAVKTTKARTVVLKKAEADISAELIALRAYFIAEKRNSTGEPGDSLTDWLEAERQLTAERQ